jgi:phosphate-selective porin O/P
MVRVPLVVIAIAAATPARGQPAPPAPPAPAVVEEAPKPENKKQKKPKKVKVSGYLQIFFKQRYDTNDDGTHEPSVFRVQRARVKIAGRIEEHVDYVVEVDPRAPEVAGIMRDAYLSIRKVIPHHKIRVGQQKTQFGYENVESSTRLYMVNRSEVSDNLSRGVNLRDIGVGVLGKLPLTETLALEDAVTVVNGAGLNVQADDTFRKNVWGRVGVRYDTADLMLRGGVSGAWGDQLEPADPGPPMLPAFDFQFTRLGFDVEAEHRYIHAAAEYVIGNDDVPLPDAGGVTQGFYVLVAGKVAYDAGPIARYDALEDYHRVTLGAFWGSPERVLRALVNYEIYEDDTGAHDHKLYLWMQGRF